MGIRPGAHGVGDEKQDKSSIHLLWVPQASGSTDIFNSSTFTSPRVSMRSMGGFLFSGSSGEESSHVCVFIHKFAVVWLAGCQAKNGYSYKPSCLLSMAATSVNVPVFKAIKRPFKEPLKGLEISEDQTPGMN